MFQKGARQACLSSFNTRKNLVYTEYKTVLKQFIIWNAARSVYKKWIYIKE